MPKARKQGHTHRSKEYTLPSAQKKKDGGVPKFRSTKPASTPAVQRNINSLGQPATSFDDLSDSRAGPSNHVDLAMGRDSSSKAFMRELRKVIERSDVIIQVLDARDPEGTRSRWVEDEVRKREIDGKKLLAVVNKIDLVPRSNLEAWLKHLRRSFPTMPFKSSTQTQRHNLSQNSIPIASSSSSSSQAIPTTQSSLGAPALLHLLKQYALSTPHSSLTVGVVGYPNVGKSSLINSLKRSRACAVAAMPGKTRIVQEVVLDKGVKIMDCPGVVLEDVSKESDEDGGTQRAAEIMLRNCIKPELVEDPITPVEVILSKSDPSQLCSLYNIPPFDDVRDFLIKIALTRGRLGKGGIPNLIGSAVSVLRDWNTGKIAYHTLPPAIHPSSAPDPVAPESDVAMSGEQVGDAKILNTLSEAFTLDGLFEGMGDEAIWNGEGGTSQADDDVHTMEEEKDLVEQPETENPTSAAPPPILPSDSEDECDDDASMGSPMALTTTLPHDTAHPTHLPLTTSNNKMFTPAELATLPAGLLDRQKLKHQAKRDKKRRAEAERTEGEIMLGFMDMGIERQDPVQISIPTKKQKKKAKKANAAAAAKRNLPTDREADEEARKELDFAKFLSNVGGDDDVDL